MLWPSPIISELVRASGLSYAYTLSNVAMHLSVVLTLIGFVQMPRAYLPTRARLDAALRYALRGYCAFAAAVGLVNVGGFYLNQYTLRYDNLLVLNLAGLLLTTTVVAYQQRLLLARPYLLANALPLLFILIVATYHVVGFYNNGNLLLPALAIMAHALSFSVALNLRLQAVQHLLLATEREAVALALDIERQELRHRDIVLKNSHVQPTLLAMQQRQQAHAEHTQQLSADHNLRAQVEANQRELASTSLYVAQKNALLAELRQQMQELRPQGGTRPQELASVQSLLQSSLHLDEDWRRFKLHFEQVHTRFLRTCRPATRP